MSEFRNREHDSGAHNSSARATAPSRRGEVAWLLLLVAGVLLVALAGVPGLPERHAGDGSDALRLGWAEQRRAAAEAAAESRSQPPQSNARSDSDRR